MPLLKLQETSVEGSVRTPRAYQSKAIDLIETQFQADDTACLILPTGTGKTFTVSWGLVDRFKDQYDRIIILTHQDPLPQQWMDAVFSVGFGRGLGVADVAKGLDLGAIVSGETKSSFTKHLQKKAYVHAGNKVIVAMLPTLKGRLPKLSDNLLGGRVLLMYDECHKTRFHDSARQLENRIRQIPDSTLHVLGVTATPARHPNEKIEFTDGYYFPQSTWISTITQAEAIEKEYWKKIQYVNNTPEYIAEAADLFSGLSVGQDGEVADTKQSAVMRALIPSHFRDWKAEQTPESITETTLWACVDRAHAHALSTYIESQGFTSMVIDGNTECKQTAIDQLNAGEVQHVAVIGCLQEGADIPRISQIVLCRIFGSTATICQIVGRGVRPWMGLSCKVFDFGQNWADHPYPCQIDWFVHQNSKKMFRDPAMVVCQDPNCRKRHDGTPKPLHPSGDRKITALISVGEYSNGDIINLDDPLVCHSCGTAVTYDEKRITKYALWQASVRLAAAAGTQPPRPKFKRSGITVGNEWDQILTPRLMYELDLWELDEPSEEGPKPPSEEDRKKKWLDRAELVQKRQNSASTKARAISYLPEELKKSTAIDMGRCREVGKTNIVRALKAALFVQYINGRSPAGAWAVFGSEEDVMRRFGPESENPVMDSKGVALKMPSAIKGKLYRDAAEAVFTQLNNCKGAQTELSEWLMAEIEKLNESERQPRHPKFQFLKTWTNRILDVEHEEEQVEDF